MTLEFFGRWGLRRTFTTGQVALICNCTPQTIIHWIERGKLSCTRFGTGPRRIPVAEVLELLKRNKAPIPDFLQQYEAASSAVLKQG